MLVTKGKCLYRCDVVHPPQNGWNVSYTSPLYNYKELGPKNQIGAFFFFEEESAAISYGHQVISENEELINQFTPEKKLWVTATQIAKEVNLLDLSSVKNVFDLYVLLWDKHINIFRDDFYLFSRNFLTKRMSLLRKSLEMIFSGNIRQEDYDNAFVQISMFVPGYDEETRLAYACQELTDFSNGPIFKEILCSKGYDGYILFEKFANVYCLFDSDSLTFPITKECNQYREK